MSFVLFIKKETTGKMVSIYNNNIVVILFIEDAADWSTMKTIHTDIIKISTL